MLYETKDSHPWGGVYKPGSTNTERRVAPDARREAAGDASEAARDEKHCKTWWTCNRWCHVAVWPSLPCEDDAMREQVPEELLMRKTLWIFSGRFWQTWGRWCSLTFLSRELSGPYCLCIVCERQQQTKNIDMLVWKGSMIHSVWRWPEDIIRNRNWVVEIGLLQN